MLLGDGRTFVLSRFRVVVLWRWEGPGQGFRSVGWPEWDRRHSDLARSGRRKTGWRLGLGVVMVVGQQVLGHRLPGSTP